MTMRPSAGELAFEFPDYPAADIPAFARNMEPRHWRNNACPSWGVTAANGDAIEVFADYADPARREFDEVYRFTVFRTPAGAAEECVLETDDEAVIAAYLTAVR